MEIYPSSGYGISWTNSHVESCQGLGWLRWLCSVLKSLLSSLYIVCCFVLVYHWHCDIIANIEVTIGLARSLIPSQDWGSRSGLGLCRSFNFLSAQLKILRLPTGLLTPSYYVTELWSSYVIWIMNLVTMGVHYSLVNTIQHPLCIVTGLKCSPCMPRRGLGTLTIVYTVWGYGIHWDKGSALTP